MFGKNMLFRFVFIAVGFAITVCGSEDSYTRNPNDEIYSEMPCRSQGGLCVRTFDCPKEARLTTKGLCPVQQKNGVECCYSLPMSETRCRKRGGRCKPKSEPCADNLTFKRATDCTKDEKCCILV